jgi:hypothetical protein
MIRKFSGVLLFYPVFFGMFAVAMLAHAGLSELCFVGLSNGL